MTATAATVVAISGELGSGGNHVGRVVAERRGMRCIDEAMLRDASEYLLANDPDLEQVQRQMDTWWTTMAGALAMGSMSGLGMLPVDTTREVELARIERRIIEEIAHQSSSVVVGQGAGQVLKGRAGVMTVLLHAPESWRVDRVAQREGATPARALDAVRASDRHRESFMRALTGSDWMDARQYDLAVNTAAIGLDAAVELVLRAMDVTAASGAVTETSE